ncbi:H(+)/Cl(-) exchange transporter ClcA [Roseomonas terrae]|jgi:CIC family chloride channel protein|uniref:H(+)/Cl(-) exchange transporter ClcA n=1 Tax=Neoroseomonas terrae TaxID=424799 RepID=A0ABS5ECZ4_9PROT|nr:H(+)/Cl(-) exchange transporter ClcA [Neoroseomonas terrae]MBR0648881.1 H(+)/Cl(-) exchange transporter ClcA [Neoroseomonas terrae]
MDEELLAQGQPGDARGEARYAALTILAGALAGVIGSFFHLAINHLMVWPRWLEQVVQGWHLVGAAALVTMLCTLLAVFIVRRFAPEAGGSGVQEIEGAMEGLRPVRWRRVLPVKFVAGVTAISSGLVLGREGPTIHIGASAAAAVAEFFRVSELERRGLLASGAAAGLACAFNAPLAAVLFVVEETHREFPYTFRTYLGVVFAAVTSTVVTQAIIGTGADLPLLVESVPLSLLPAFLLLGAVLGVAGVALNAAILGAVEFSARCQRHAPYLYPAVIGLAVGALVILLPQSVTGGDGVILQLAAAHPGLSALLLLAGIRFLTTIGSYSSGVPGGIFAPMLTLAVCIGFAFGEAARMLLPDAGIVPLAFAIVAMGGLFSASIRAPIVGVALALELTGSYALVVPLLITCGVADLAAQWAGGRPIYSQLLERTLRQAGIRRPAASPEPTGLG